MDRRNTITFGAIFLLYAAGSLLWSSDPAWGAAQLAALALGIPLAYFPTHYLWIAAAIAAPFIVDGPNVIGAFLALGLAASLAYGVWPYLVVPAAAIGIIMTESRTAMVGAAVAIFGFIWRHNRLAAITIAAIILIDVFHISGGRSASLAQRLGIWHDTGVHLTLFGAGLGSFYTDYWDWTVHTNATLVRAVHVYNDPLELVYLLGVGTIPLWFFIAGAWGATGPRDRLLLITFGVLSLSFFPLFIFPLNTLLVATLVRALALPIPFARRRLAYEA